MWLKITKGGSNIDILELKSHRVRKGLTQKDVANLLGLTASTYTKKENYQIPFSLRELKVLKMAFELDDKEFMKIFFKQECDFESR